VPRARRARGASLPLLFWRRKPLSRTQSRSSAARAVPVLLKCGTQLPQILYRLLTWLERPLNLRMVSSLLEKRNRTRRKDASYDRNGDGSGGRIAGPGRLRFYRDSGRDCC